MTNRLAALRTNLASLAKARARVRALTAWSTAAIAVLVGLALCFLLDVVFEMAIAQRVLLLLAVAGGVSWVGWRFTRPLLRVHEDTTDMALLVERQQRINNDLIGAMQFEGRPDEGWGSAQLSSAVIDYVAAVGKSINVFDGFSATVMQRRLGLLGGCLLALLLLGAVWPGHVAVFANRLLLGSRHYPTRTRIQQIVIGREPVLTDENHSAPASSKQAQGQPLTVLVQCSGVLPAEGVVQFASLRSPKSRTKLLLKPLSAEQRRARLQQALDKLDQAVNEQLSVLSPTFRTELQSLIRFDATTALARLQAAQSPADLASVRSAVAEALQAWPEIGRGTAIYSGELSRLNDSLHYKILLGDAWTDPATVEMIPLPVVELRQTITPPPYARGSVEKPDSSGRQWTVLEGSSVGLGIECQNERRLKSAWLIVRGKGPPAQFDLAPTDSNSQSWAAGSVPLLKDISDRLDYEIQVLDEDGLSLDSPLRGTILVRRPQPPEGRLDIVHKVVLPTAEPVVQFRASDDFALARLELVVELQRRGGLSNVPPSVGEGTAAARGDSVSTAAVAETVPIEPHRYDLLPVAQSITPERATGVAFSGVFPLPLASLQLVKGDRLKLSLELQGERGEERRNAAARFQSASVDLEVSDLAGVLAAVSQADAASEERLGEVIKRQLGIGEAQ